MENETTQMENENKMQSIILTFSWSITFSISDNYKILTNTTHRLYGLKYLKLIGYKFEIVLEYNVKKIINCWILVIRANHMIPNFCTNETLPTPKTSTLDVLGMCDLNKFCWNHLRWHGIRTTYSDSLTNNPFHDWLC